MRSAIFRQGFTLTETAIVLGVVAAMLAGVWAMSGSVREQSNSVDVVNQLQTIKQSILDYRQGHPWDATSSSKVSELMNLGIIPKQYENPANAESLITPFGGSSYLVISAPNTNTFRMSYYKVPNLRACLDILFQATACQAGTVGCPFAVGTKNAPSTKKPDSMPAGWQVLRKPSSTYPSLAQDMCDKNVYPDGANSLEFDYSF